MESLRMMGWGLVVAESSSAAAAVAAAAVVVVAAVPPKSGCFLVTISFTNGV